MAKDTKPLIILDPFRYAHAAEENDSTEMMRIMQQLRYCASVGAAVVIIHHPAKAEGSTGRGSSAIRGAVDVAFMQEMSDETGIITLKCVKNRFGEKFMVTIRPDFEEGNFEVADSPQFTKRANEIEKLRKIIEEKPGQSQNQVTGFSGMTKKRAQKLLKEGCQILWDVRTGGRNSLNYYPLNWFPKLETSEKTSAPVTSFQGTGSVVSPPYQGRTTAPVERKTTRNSS